MKLSKVDIDSFKTIATPQELFLDARAITLVGANESGKTNLLRAIELLSPHQTLKKEDISKGNIERCKQKVLPCLTYTFSLHEEEINKIAKIFPELSGEDTITIKRSGNGLEGYSIVASSSKLLPKLTSMKNALIKEKEKLESQMEKSNSEYNELTKKSNLMINSITQTHGDVIPPSKKEIIDKIQKEFRNSHQTWENEQKEIPHRINALQADIKNVEFKSEAAKNDLLLTTVDSLTDLLKLLPKIFYLENFEPLPESVPIAEIKEQKTSLSKIVGNLLRLGKIFNFSDLDEDYRTLNRTLKGASAIISERFNEFWSQEDVEIFIEKQTTNLGFSINGGISVSSSPKERSMGFQWLLSFFSHFAANFDKISKNTIFIFDEPAALLHPRGQKDVLGLLEKIAQDNQIVYSTHSPFLINRNFPQRVRLLIKNAKEGTIIDNKPYSDNRVRFWEPLKSSIGASLGDLLSLGETNLIVEGFSDKIFITGVSKKFSELELPFLDLEKVSVLDAMGVNNEKILAQFAASMELEAISLLDNDCEGKRVLKILKEEKINAISINELKQEAVTIEDLFPEEVYIQAVNSYYSHFEGFKEYKKEKEKTAGIVKKFLKYFNQLDLEFNKVDVANHLIQNLDINEHNISKYNSFKELFNRINKLQQKEDTN